MKKILILDFGSQYAHLIARRFRNLGYYSEIAYPDCDIKDIKKVKGIVLSGGPSSVYSSDAPKFNSKILNLNVPILGLCYGHQLLLKEYGGIVKKAKVAEYGFAVLNKIKESPLFKNINFPTQIWMSHSDEVVTVPEGFEIIASTKDCKIAATQNLKLKRFTLQFHPEVKDTINGTIYLENFAKFCKMKKNWNTSKLIISIQKRIKKEAKKKNVILFLSGGVDSSVTFALLVKTLGKKKVLGLYINNGFMRKNETEMIKSRYLKIGLDNFIIEDAEDKFLNAIKKIVNPQEKRKIIGETFLKVKDDVIKRLNLHSDEWLLAQGTLYPDIIESGGTKHSAVIKTHHNRVEGVKDLLEKGLVIEPLKDLYKDEVRVIGKKLGLPDEIIARHPFPGPGLSINCICSDGNIDTNEINKLKELLDSDSIEKKIENIKINLSILPIKSVGVQGDFRTYHYPVVVKIPNNGYELIKWEEFEKYSSYLTNRLNTNRVVLELFSKTESKLFEAYCTKERLDMIREIDEIVLSIYKKHNYYNKIFQHLTINIPYATKKEHCSIVLRPVVSEDVMTCRFAFLPLFILKEIIDSIKKISFVDNLYYDITNKPPATFGWE